MNITFDDNVTRALDNIDHPAQVFIHRPDFVINVPVEIKQFFRYWNQIEPQSLDSAILDDNFLNFLCRFRHILECFELKYLLLKAIKK